MFYTNSVERQLTICSTQEQEIRLLRTSARHLLLPCGRSRVFCTTESISMSSSQVPHLEDCVRHHSKAGAQAAGCLFPCTPRQSQGRAAYNITSTVLKESHCLFRAENRHLQCLQELSGTRCSAGEHNEPHWLPGSCLSQV